MSNRNFLASSSAPAEGGLGPASGVKEVPLDPCQLDDLIGPGGTGQLGADESEAGNTP